MKIVDRALVLIVVALLVAIGIEFYRKAKQNLSVPQQVEPASAVTQSGDTTVVSATVTLNPKIGEGIAKPGAVPPPTK